MVSQTSNPTHLPLTCRDRVMPVRATASENVDFAIKTRNWRNLSGVGNPRTLRPTPSVPALAGKQALAAGCNTTSHLSRWARPTTEISARHQVRFFGRSAIFRRQQQERLSAASTAALKSVLDLSVISAGIFDRHHISKSRSHVCDGVSLSWVPGTSIAGRYCCPCPGLYRHIAVHLVLRAINKMMISHPLCTGIFVHRPHPQLSFRSLSKLVLGDWYRGTKQIERRRAV